MLASDEELMQAAAGTARQFGVPFYGLAGTAHESVCQAMGVEFVAELYVDLNYGPAGELLIQRRPAPTDPAAAAERVSRAITGRPVVAVDGTELHLSFQSICVHSDSPNAPAVASAVRAALG
jgi:5-oxoprolinase (ATP-hydrolysing) subunit A